MGGGPDKRTYCTITGSGAKEKKEKEKEKGNTKAVDCAVGQGHHNAPILEKSSDNSKDECYELCAQKVGCNGFDFTSNSQGGACRLYGPNEPRKIGGPDKRTYCTLTGSGGKDDEDDDKDKKDTKDKK